MEELLPALKGTNKYSLYVSKTQQWPQDWKRSVFIPIPKKGNAKECSNYCTVQFSHSVVSNSVTPWTAASQASLSITNSWSLLKVMFIQSVMPSNHLIVCHPLLLLPPIPSSIRVFSNQSTLRMRWPKYWSFSFSIQRNPRADLLQNGLVGSPCSPKGLSRVFSNTTVQKHQFFGAQPSSQSNSHIHTWPLEKP